MHKEDPEVPKLVNLFKERRKELAKKMREGQIERKTHENDHLDSNSRFGKALELTICNRFNAVHENQKDRAKLLKQDKKLSINTLTDRLVYKAQIRSSKWRIERQREEHLQLMLASLTNDKRIQRELRDYSENLPNFVGYLKNKSKDYLLRLGVP